MDRRRSFGRSAFCYLYFNRRRRIPDEMVLSIFFNFSEIIMTYEEYRNAPGYNVLAWMKKKRKKKNV